MKKKWFLNDRVPGIDLIVWEDIKTNDKPTFNDYIFSWELKLHHSGNLTRQGKALCHSVSALENWTPANESSMGCWDCAELMCEEVPTHRKGCSSCTRWMWRTVMVYARPVPPPHVSSPQNVVGESLRTVNTWDQEAPYSFCFLYWDCFVWEEQRPLHK